MTLEVFGVEVETKNNNVLIIGICKPQKAIGENYYNKLMHELHALSITTQIKQTVTMTGNLNLDRINTNRRECNGLM